MIIYITKNPVEIINLKIYIDVDNLNNLKIGNNINIIINGIEKKY